MRSTRSTTRARSTAATSSPPSARDPRVRVLRHAANQGVGGATITGYRAALADGRRHRREARRRRPDGPARDPAARRADRERPGRLREGQPLPRARVPAHDAARAPVRQFDAVARQQVRERLLGHHGSRPTASPRSTAPRSRCCRSTRSTAATSSSRTCCSGSTPSAPSCATCRCRRVYGDEPSSLRIGRVAGALSAEVPARDRQADVLHVLPARLQRGHAAALPRARSSRWRASRSAPGTGSAPRCTACRRRPAR